MEQTQNNPQAAVSASETNLAELSLADYRAQREGTAAKDKGPKAVSEPPAEAEESADENAASAEGAADETEDDASEKETPAGDKPAKKEGGFQKKIRQRDERIADLERQLAERNAPAAAKPADKPAENQGAPKPAEPQFAKPKPKLEDFESLETFTEALSDWKADEREFRKLAAERRTEIEKSNRTILDNFKAKETEAKKAHADYDAVLKSAEAIQIPAPITRTIIESEHGPEIAYYLAQHQDELKALAKMHPLKAAVAIGKLETRFDSANTSEDEDRSTSTAPAPPRHVNSGRATVKPDMSKVSLSDYRRMREAGKVA